MDVSQWPLFQPVCFPAWFIVLSTIILMITASCGQYHLGKMEGKIEEKENRMNEEEK